jgi:lipopolysaccharide transport system ATP-binding protein
MLSFNNSKKENDNAIIVEKISKGFKIPYEKKRTVFENIASIFKNRYGYEEFWALQDINITIKHGDTVGIIGQNGSGKSTLLKIIAGVLYPDIGKIKVNGNIAPFLELGVGFQPELTARENVYLYGAIMGIGKKDITKKYEEIFEFAELKKFENMRLKNFSSGMAMRLAFSTAIATDPDIFLIDEVLAVGDESFQKKCFQKFDEFKNDGKTIVLVSHGLSNIRKVCEKGILLNGGKIKSEGDIEKVINDYNKLLNNRENSCIC